MVREIRNGRLFFDGCDTVELAREYGTPLYVLSETAIVSKIAELRSAFLGRYANTSAAYAGKAFLTKAMCRIIEREGLCLDIVSGGELCTAMRAGFPADRIEFNGNNKLESEIRMALDYGVRKFIADSMDELRLLGTLCLSMGRSASVLLRISPGIDAGGHAHISTGGVASKFGFPAADVAAVTDAASFIKSSERLDFVGLHTHIGSQIFSPDDYVRAVRVLLDLADMVESLAGVTVSELNIGGGFGVKYAERNDESEVPFEAFFEPVMDEVDAHYGRLGLPRPTVSCEPGRSIVAGAGITLYTVGTVKSIPGVRDYVFVDGGMTDNIRPGLYGAVYDGMVASRADEPCTRRVYIAGKCCESTDILIEDIPVPESTAAGDIYAIFGTGAYGVSMASNYNKIPRPAVVLVHDCGSELIVRRQTLDDLVDGELIPAGLGTGRVRE
jgi:diaminopimelate decarboxylase